MTPGVQTFEQTARTLVTQDRATDFPQILTTPCCSMRIRRDLYDAYKFFLAAFREASERLRSTVTLP
jgi:hypothetical protein